MLCLTCVKGYCSYRKSNLRRSRPYPSENILSEKYFTGAVKSIKERSLSTSVTVTR